MAFDAKGRLFVGMGPQYRKPKPETPGDSVVMLLDTDGDGRADQTKVFATGFNAIQGLAWHGRDLWIANAPDLTIVTNNFTLTARQHGWLLLWSAEFRAGQQAIAFGDQEEMGFGARVATAFTEENGGLIRSSTGKPTAKQTWGQPASWCDYSGSGPRSGGIMLMASPTNFRESWWHNRKYGAFVSNPFGRKAMKQGEVSSIKIAPGKTMRITFGALVHDHRKFEAAAEYELFKQLISQ